MIKSFFGRSGFLWAVCSILFFSVGACGYHFQGGGYLNNDIRKIAVEAFENKSSESGAGMAFTNALAEQIVQKTYTKVVDGRSDVLRIKGVIQSIRFSELSRETTESVVERTVTTVVDLKIVDADGEIVWAVKSLTTSDSYEVSDVASLDESNKRDAVNQIAERTAEKIVSRMLNNF